MRIRQVKPAFWEDEGLADLSYAVRLFYIGLWNLSDDDGYFELRPGQIAAALYRYESRAARERHVREWIDRLVETGHVHLLDCGQCARIPALPNHQRVTGKQSFYVKAAHDKHRLLTGKPPIAPVVVRGTGNGTGTGTVAPARAPEGAAGAGREAARMVASSLPKVPA